VCSLQEGNRAPSPTRLKILDGLRAHLGLEEMALLGSSRRFRGPKWDEKSDLDD
jgi:hypothetical protein